MHYKILIRDMAASMSELAEEQSFVLTDVPLSVVASLTQRAASSHYRLVEQTASGYPARCRLRFERMASCRDSASPPIASPRM